MSLASAETERRRFRRYPSADLKAQVKVKKGLFSGWQDVDVSDFNAHGMAIIIPRKDRLAGKIYVRLTLEMDMGSISIEKIDATCMNQHDELGRNRIGVQFDEDQLARQAEVRDQLERIQRILEKNSSVTSRLSTQN